MSRRGVHVEPDLHMVFVPLRLRGFGPIDVAGGRIDEQRTPYFLTGEET